MVKVQSGKFNKSKQWLISLIKSLLVATVLERIEVVLPLHLVVLVEIQVFRQILRDYLVVYRSLDISVRDFGKALVELL